jgi:hypothetical protein
MSKIPENVLRGAAFLDSTLPGWDKKIDLDKLNLSDSCNCVLGQQSKAKILHTRYRRTAKRLGLDPFGREVQRLGFMTWGRQSFSGLTNGWKHLIEARRAAS